MNQHEASSLDPLSTQMKETDEQLMAVLVRPDDWPRGALEAARAELEIRKNAGTPESECDEILPNHATSIPQCKEAPQVDGAKMKILRVISMFFGVWFSALMLVKAFARIQSTDPAAATFVLFSFGLLLIWAGCRNWNRFRMPLGICCLMTALLLSSSEVNVRKAANAPGRSWMEEVANTSRQVAIIVALAGLLLVFVQMRSRSLY